jgi:hypothetical protein
MTYVTNQTEEYGYDYLEWTAIVDKLRHNLNDAKKYPPDVDLITYVPIFLNLKLEILYIIDLKYQSIRKEPN